MGAGRARIKEVEWQLGTVRNRKSPSSSIKSKRLSFPATEILHGPHNSYRRAEPEISSKKLHSVRPHDQDVRVCVCVCAAACGQVGRHKEPLGGSGISITDSPSVPRLRGSPPAPSTAS